jgi:hypothetical protein
MQPQSEVYVQGLNLVSTIVQEEDFRKTLRLVSKACAHFVDNNTAALTCMVRRINMIDW